MVAMSWLEAHGFQRRPLVLIEDHLYHIGEVLDLLARERPEWIRQLTVVCLDRPGADTRNAVEGWLEDHPELQMAARLVAGPRLEVSRFVPLEDRELDRSSELARRIAGWVRPRGLLLQDVQLETLAFIPRQRWWESIYLASSVRGLFAERPPACRFLSNKRGYEATFGRDLLDAGFDPRDVLDKGQLRRQLLPTVETYLARTLPLRLRSGTGGEPCLETVVGREETDRIEIEEALDLVLWIAPQGTELGGGWVTSGSGARHRLRLGSPECATWRALIEDHLGGSGGLPVLEVGERVAPEHAGRPEVTNCAARHIHQLRSRLRAGTAIRTANHAYSLDHSLRAAIVEG